MKYHDSLRAAAEIVGRVQSGSAALRTDAVAEALRIICRADLEDALKVLAVQFPYINRDAERYRWIAAHGGCPFAETDDAWDSKENLDARVDECIALETGQQTSPVEGTEH
jgi:hypothetical protein